ncbi:MAG: hypothetical protein ACRC9K_23360 [Afipia sp.]
MRQMNERLAGKLALMCGGRKGAPEPPQSGGVHGQITRSFNKLADCRAKNPDLQLPADRREALAAQAKKVYIRRN